MAKVHLIMLLSLVEYFVFTIAVGRARYAFGVKAPATSGHPDFERYYRAQMNTLEQLVIFIPALWTFATFVNGDVAAILGAVFIVGRAMYFFGYVKAAEKRSAGFGLSTLATLALLIGGIIGAFGAM
jgi:glutathione S-transferase